VERNSIIAIPDPFSQPRDPGSRNPAGIIDWQKYINVRGKNVCKWHRKHRLVYRESVPLVVDVLVLWRCGDRTVLMKLG